MNEKLYSKITDALVDNGYIVLEDALSLELTKNLLDFAKEEKRFSRACISGAGDLHVDSKKRRDTTCWLEEDNSIQSEFLALSEGLRQYLNRSLYLGLSYYEAHFAIYDEGDFYEKHLDAFKNSKNRVVTIVYYLNDEWSEADGGELVIYDVNDDFLTKIIPKENTLVVFLSDQFPHEVKPAKKKRYSIAGWFRIDK